MRDAVSTPVEAALHSLNQNWTEPSSVLPLDDEWLFERAAAAILEAAQSDASSEQTADAVPSLLLAPHESDETAEEFIERVGSADTATAIHVDMAAKRVPPEGMAVLMPVAAVRREAVTSVCNAMLRRAGPIDTLDLSGNAVTADAMLAIAECIATCGIQHLILPGLIGTDSINPKQFIDALNNSKSSSNDRIPSQQCVDTITLNLSNAKMGDISAALIGQLNNTGAISSVRTLNISNCFIGGISGNGPHVQCLTEALAASHHITELDVSRNNLSDAAIHFIAYAAQYQCPSLRALNVNTNIVKQHGARALGLLLGTNRMTALSVASCSLDDRSIGRLCQGAMETYDNLVLELHPAAAASSTAGCDLDLSYSRFGVAGVTALSFLLQKSRSDCLKIAGLRLRCCDMTAALHSPTAGSLLHCIYSSKYLQVVDLSGTHISDIAALHCLNELERSWELSVGMHVDTAKQSNTYAVTASTVTQDTTVADTAVTCIEPPIAALNMSRCGISVLVTEKLASLLQRAATSFTNQHPLRVLCLRQANTGVRGLAAIKRWLDVDNSIQLLQLGDRRAGTDTANTTDITDQVSLLNSIESSTVLQYQLWPLCKKVALISCCTIGNSANNTVLPQDALALIFKMLQTPVIRRVVKDSAAIMV
jgi:Leucine Rich repeat